MGWKFSKEGEYSCVKAFSDWCGNVDFSMLLIEWGGGHKIRLKMFVCAWHYFWIKFPLLTHFARTSMSVEFLLFKMHYSLHYGKKHLLMHTTFDFPFQHSTIVLLYNFPCLLHREYICKVFFSRIRGMLSFFLPYSDYAVLYSMCPVQRIRF